jgi:hypothetical protein
MQILIQAGSLIAAFAILAILAVRPNDKSDSERQG